MRSHIGLIALALVPALGWSQQLSLGEAVGAALATEPSLAAAAAEHDVARAAADEAAAALEPQVNLAGSAMRYEEPMVVSPIHGFTPGLIPEFDRTLVQSSLSATYLLWDGGGARARVRQARALAGAAEETVAQIRQALVARTVAAYTGVLTAAENLVAEQRRLEALGAEERRIEQLKRVGRAADVEVYRVEAARAAGEAARTMAVTRLEVAEADLARLTGFPRERTRASNLAPVPASRDPEPVDEATVLAANPRVAAARRQLAAAEAALVAASAGRKPQINVASAVNQFGGGDLDFTYEWNAGLQLRLPVLDGGATRARIARARASAEAAQARVRVAEPAAGSELDRAAAEVRNARARFDSHVVAAQRSAEVARDERLRLDVGAGTQSEYLRAEADLVAARAAVAAARQALALARVELARVAGTLDTQWIEATFGSEP
ncbi:MAG TPA: TolC family protein [Thermoanaerobaculia bacterium]